MRLSLSYDGYESDWSVNLSGSDTKDSFCGSLGLLENLIKRLKQLPTGNPMNDHMGVTVDLSACLIHFASCSFYGTGAEIVEQMRNDQEELTVSEFMLVPEAELSEWVTTKSVQEYKRRHYPKGQKLSVAECLKRFPWMIAVVSQDEEDIIFHEVQLGQGEELTPGRVNFERSRQSVFCCQLRDNDGLRMADADSDCWTTSEDAPHGSWEELLKRTTYLVMGDFGSDKCILCVIKR